jgi:hypothetical protein
VPVTADSTAGASCPGAGVINAQIGIAAEMTISC